MRLRSTASDTPFADPLGTGSHRGPDRADLAVLPSPQARDAAADPEAIGASPQTAETGVTDGILAEATPSLLPDGADQPDALSPAAAALPLLPAGDPRIDPVVVTAFDGDAPAAARIRDLRAALTSRWHADPPDDRRAVALVGVDAGVDVAVVAANLAVASAQLGWRTLLVDGDLHAPMQDRLFRVPAEHGLSTLLQHRDGARAALQPTAIARLALLPAGPPSPDAAEALERQPLLDALDGRIGRQRLVLVSLSAPPHSSRFGAVDTVLHGFDGAILVAGRNRSALRPLQRLTLLLEEAGVPVLATAVQP